MKLPKRVYLKHSAFYYVSPDHKWHRLCQEREGLPAMHRALGKLVDISSSPLLPAVIARWQDAERSKWSDKHAEDMERVCRRIAEEFEAWRPDEVDAKACDDYLELVKTDRTYNVHRSVLKRVLSFAARKGLRTGYNPVSDIPTKACPGRKRMVTDAEVDGMRAVAGARKRNPKGLTAVLELCLLTGQRIGDVIALRWQDVTDAGILVKQGKTGERLLIEWTPALQAAVKACERGHRIGHVVQKEAGGAYTYSGVRSGWLRACKAAGIEDLTIHDLRGRAGVDALGEEQDMRQAQKLLGHKGEGMTRKYVDGKYHKRVKPSR